MLFAAMVSYTLNVNWVNCPIICLTIGVQSDKLGTTWEQTLTNTVQNRDARHRKMLDEPTTWRFCSCLGRGRPLDSLVGLWSVRNRLWNLRRQENPVW